MLTAIDIRGFMVTCRAEGGEAAGCGCSGTDDVTTAVCLQLASLLGREAQQRLRRFLSKLERLATV